ncbi:YopX family protein [Lacticaseibacillus paracasei]
MKREIKFRAFLNSKYYEKPRMLSWGELLEQYDAIDMFQRDLMTLMQYTGLHDKNGRSIYEGDIIVTHPTTKYETPKSGVVQYGGSRPMFGYKAEDGDYYSIWSNNVYRTYEVIGNIFENPELLEGKQ